MGFDIMKPEQAHTKDREVVVGELCDDRVQIGRGRLDDLDNLRMQPRVSKEQRRGYGRSQRAVRRALVVVPSPWFMGTPVHHLPGGSTPGFFLNLQEEGGGQKQIGG